MTLDKETLYWIFSTLPQVLAAWGGLIFTGYVFFIQRIESKSSNDSYYHELTKVIKESTHYKITWIVSLAIVIIILDTIYLSYIPFPEDWCINPPKQNLTFQVFIILLIVNRFKKRKHLTVIGIISIVLSSIVLLNGCYDAFLRPKYKQIDMSKEELVDFAEYVIEDERFKDINNFLPNNETLIKSDESFHETLSDKRDWDKIYSVKTMESTYLYRYSCQLSCFVDEFESEEMASNYFQDNIEIANADPDDDIITKDNYCIYAPPIEHEATFFNLHEGDHSTKHIRIVILYGKYQITFLEVATGKPLIFGAAKRHQFFNENTML